MMTLRHASIHRDSSGKQRGMSMIELLIAMTVMAVGISGILSLVLLAIAATFGSNHIAARIAFDHGVNITTAVAARSTSPTNGPDPAIRTRPGSMAAARSSGPRPFSAASRPR